MRIIAIVNSKGGAGKTVTTRELGSALVTAGHSVLLCDMDMNGTLSNFFAIENDGRPTMEDVLRGAAGIEEAARQVRDGLWLLPATANMERTQHELAVAPGGEVRLRRAFKDYVAQGGSFDFVLIDCPSGWGATTRNALLASQLYIVPISSEPDAYTEAINSVAAADQLAGYHDHHVELLGVLLTMYRRYNVPKLIEAKSETQWGDKLFQTRIRRTEVVNELRLLEKTSGESGAAGVREDYAALATEVIWRTMPEGNNG